MSGGGYRRDWVWLRGWERKGRRFGNGSGGLGAEGQVTAGTGRELPGRFGARHQISCHWLPTVSPANDDPFKKFSAEITQPKSGPRKFVQGQELAKLVGVSGSGHLAHEVCEKRRVPAACHCPSPLTSAWIALGRWSLRFLQSTKETSSKENGSNLTTTSLPRRVSVWYCRGVFWRHVRRTIRR